MDPIAETKRIARGRWMYLTLAALLVGLEVVGLIHALFLSDTKLKIWNSIFIPAIFVYSIVELWNGQRINRWIVGIWLILKGGLPLIGIGIALKAMASASHSDSGAKLFRIIAMALLIPAAFMLFYAVSGLLIMFSKNMQAFFDQQLARESENPWLAGWDWLLCLVSPERRRAREMDRFFHEHKHRKRYAFLTREILESQEGYDLVQVVIDYVHLQIGDDYANQYKIVSEMPRGIQAVYSTWWVEAEVNNGGFHQYFHNKGIDFAFMALEGYKLLGANDLATLMAQAIETYLREEPEQLQFRSNDPHETLENYLKARELSSLPELDSRFYQLNTNDHLAEHYIKTHLDEFVTQ